MNPTYFRSSSRLSNYELVRSRQLSRRAFSSRVSVVQADVTARETTGVQALKIAAAAAFGALGGVFLLNLHLLIHLIR